MSETHETGVITGAAAQMGMRADAGPFARALISAAQVRPELIGMTADVAKYTDMQAFAELFPDRFLNVGMAEQNLIAAAAGIAMAGLLPVLTAFGVFMTRRAHDFTVMQIGLQNANVKLIGAVPGVSSTFGPSHCSFEDIAMMRAIPNMVVIDPADGGELGEAVTAAIVHDGPVYIRQPFHRPDEVSVVPPGRFKIGKAALLREGGDAGIIASGMMVWLALEAAEILAGQGIAVGVLKISTLKPFDAEAVAEFAAHSGALVTAENHSIIGGLFSATAEAVTRRGISAVIEPIGVPDVFPEFGSPGYLIERLGMSGAAICGAVKRAMAARGGNKEAGDRT